MIHWRRRKKIQDDLEAENNTTQKKVVLSDKIIVALQAYVKRYYVETPKNKAKPPASAMVSRGAKKKHIFHLPRNWMNMLKKKKIRYSPGT